MAEDMRELGIAWVRSMQMARIERGYLGEPVGPGQYRFDSIKPGRMKARIRKSDNTIAVIDVVNHRVPRNPTIEILLDQNIDGEWEVIGVAGNRAMQNAGEYGGQYMGVGPHSHRIGFGLEDLTEARRIEPGLVTVATGMSVFVYPFDYEHEGTHKYWEGGTIDLTAHKPATTRWWQWAKVGLDPATNTLVAANEGVEYADSVSLTKANLIAIPFTGYRPLAGVKLKETDTSINEEARFTDLRQWFGSSGSGFETTLTRIVVACGEVVTWAGQVVWEA